MENIVEFIDVNKSFAGTELYKEDLNFTISNKDAFGIAGKSGCGKSTILNIIMGFMKIDKGILKVFGNEITPEIINQFRLQSIYIPQNFNFFKGKSVRDIINKPFTFNSNKSINITVDHINQTFDKLNLPQKLLDNDISELSGGERQRIAAVIAILLNREVVIMDEPTSNLDTQNSEKLINEFIDLGKTLIISSHDSSILKRCNKLLELK